jgi:flagellum-specific peptidoglycan hydrolase FlgJ
MPLVEAFGSPSGGRSYRLRPEPEVTRALRLAYGHEPEEIERRRRGLARVAALLDAGEGVQARIEAVLLALPEIAPENMAKLAHAAALQKANPNWAEQPRKPAGSAEGGQWTSDGGAAGTEGATNDSSAEADANIRPAAAQVSEVQARKERFVDAHLADAQIGADQLSIPVENILGISALESGWGEHPFAAQGNNFFGIHYPAPYATGYMLTKDGRTKVATFASYADSLKSFIAISGSLIRGRRDPIAFAAALQNAGKFGINTKTGGKMPAYVRGARYGQDHPRARCDRRAEEDMRLALWVAASAFASVGGVVTFNGDACAAKEQIPWKIDEPAAQRLAAEANFNADKYLGSLDYASNMGHPFFVYYGINDAPAIGGFGYFAVNPWTGDVWALWGCHRMSTPALRKSQAAIRRRFTREEMKQYVRLRRLKPECIVED